jgi:hypothetical protein
MKTITDYYLTEDKSVMQKAGRIAGITFLFNLIVPTLGYIFIQSKLFVQGNLFLTAENILDNEGLFRLGILLEVILAVGLVALGYSLYVMLKHVNPYFAKFAFIIKVVEASLMAVVTLISFFSLQLLIHSAEISTLNENSIHVFAGFIFNQHGILNAVPMFFLGIEMGLFTVLLYKSVFVPKWISGFGILSFSLIFIYAILSIIHPTTNLMLLTLPSFLFELVCGGWLLLKGISVDRNIQIVG